MTAVESRAVHGTAAMYNNHGCRCDDCRAAATAARYAWATSLKGRTPAEIPHGTQSGYRNWKCRCPDCCAWREKTLAERRASAAAARDARAAARPGPPSRRPGGHGTASRYSNHGCRCVPCTEAKKVKDAAYRKRRRAKIDAALAAGSSGDAAVRAAARAAARAARAAAQAAEEARLREVDARLAAARREFRASLRPGPVSDGRN